MADKKHVPADSYMRKGYQDGGPVAGPSTPPDSVPIAATGGEFVIPAEVVAYRGTKFFNDLIQQTLLEMQGPPNPFTDMATNDMGEMEPANGPARAPRRA